MQFRFVVSVLSADIAKKFTFGQTLVSALSFRSISLSADREKILFRSNTIEGINLPARWIFLMLRKLKFLGFLGRMKLRISIPLFRKQEM